MTGDSKQGALVSGSLSAMFQAMENSLEKLKCLNYEEHFIKKRRQNPVGREHFAIQGSNTSLQFQHFLELTSWLFSIINGEDESYQVDQFEDPNTSVHKLMLALREVDFHPDFPATKLKLAHGEAVVTVLDFLTDLALKKSGFMFHRPKRNKSIGGFDSQHNGLDEISAEDEILDEVHDPDEDEEEMTDEPMTVLCDSSDGILDKSDNQIIESSVSPVEWRTELERVGPRLRVTFAERGEGWRVYAQQTINHDQRIREESPSTEAHLSQVRKEIAEAIERIETKESFINNAFSQFVRDYEEEKESSKATELTHSRLSNNVGDLANELASITDQLNEVKKEMDSKGSSMTDTSPLIQIKTALQNLKAEIKAFDLRISVVNHTLIQAKLLDARNNDSSDGDNDDTDDSSFEM